MQNKMICSKSTASDLQPLIQSSGANKIQYEVKPPNMFVVMTSPPFSSEKPFLWAEVDHLASMLRKRNPLRPNCNSNTLPIEEMLLNHL